MEQQMVRRVTIHKSPGDVPSGAPGDVVAVGFAQKLQARMAAKGWSQKDLAERATLQLPEGAPVVSPSNISKYVNAREMPTPVKMLAIATALGVKPEDLVNTDAVNAVGRNAAKVSITDIGNGRVWMKVNQSFSMANALKILAVISEEGPTEA
jgi:transcriptional regulator with XRE-family HTH domain